MTIDRWGTETSGERRSIDAWNETWSRFVHFTEDPTACLTEPNERDDTFAMGSIFCALYAVLSGSRLDTASVTDHADRARQRARQEAERAHVEALDTMIAGDFSAAARQWAALAATGDFAAFRFAHDTFLHVGDAATRIETETAAHRCFADHPGRSYVDGMMSFSCNEVHEHERARDLGSQALAADPLDLWARHALAHVYEDTEDSGASFALLADTATIWGGQDQLATHVWWHLGLRHLANDNLGDVLSIYDHQLPVATTAFRLCDMTSLLWRAELNGHDVGDRWSELASRWADIDQRHTCGFLDLHATLAFIREPAHPGAEVWANGLDARPAGTAEIDDIFATVVGPLVTALRQHDADGLDAVIPTLHRIGGSNAQRSIVPLTAGAWK